MPIGADVTPSEPAVIRAIVIRTEVPRGVDRASASPREDDHRRWRARGFGTRIESLLTGLTQRFMEVSRERFGFFSPLAPGFGRLARHLGCGTARVRAADMNEEADQHESDHEKLIKQHVRSHDGVPSQGSERRLFYSIDSRWNYPLCAGTGPAESANPCI